VPSYQHHPQAFDCQLPLAPFVSHADLPLGNLVSAAEVQQALDQHHLHFGDKPRAVFTAAITLWTWLWQCLSAEKSCLAAVGRTSVLLAALELGPWSEDTGCYCRARCKLPAALVRQLALTIGQRVEAAAPAAWLWRGRHVYLCDGSTATLADSAANQATFPQAPTHQPGLGFPIIRFVVLRAFATATIQGLAYGPYEGKETGETALLRQLLERLDPGAVFVADRHYCTYWLVAALWQREIDVVFRMHHKRKYDLHSGQRLGAGDHLTVWQRPQRPAWMSAEEYATIPEQLQVRELLVQVRQRGYRTRELVVVTTLLDAKQFSTEDVGELYHQRWHAELDLRTLKQTLGVDTLRCTAPELVERELWLNVLAYNLVRKVMAQAVLWAAAQPARRHRGGLPTAPLTPRQLSFTGAKQQVLSWWDQHTGATPAAQRQADERLLRAASKKRVGRRPGRCEPRAKKRRAKPYDLLMEPRAQARARLLEGDDRCAGGGEQPIAALAGKKPTKSSMKPRPGPRRQRVGPGQGSKRGHQASGKTSKCQAK
jgi:putative transposase